MIWKRFIPLFVLWLPSLSFAKGTAKQFPIYNFAKGVDTYHASLSLGDGYVQGSNNVFFDAQAPVQKRQGYTVAWHTGLSTNYIVIQQGVNNSFAIFDGGNHYANVYIPQGNYTFDSIGTQLVNSLNSTLLNGLSVTFSSSSLNGDLILKSVSGGAIGLGFSAQYYGQVAANTGNTLGWSSTQGDGGAGIYLLFTHAGISTAPYSPTYSPVVSSGSLVFQNLWTYTDPTNTTWLMVRSSGAIIANNLAGKTVQVATVSVSNLVGETNAFGYAFFVDQSQGVYYWNGTSVTYVGASPYGSIITSFHNRLWVAGAAAPNGGQLYGSAEFTGTTWTPNVNPNDPVQLPVGLQDNQDNITALYVYLDTLYVFKHYATYALYGFDQTSFQVSEITQECGCIDGGSIQTFGGDLKFMSLRGVEDFNGYVCKRISDPIKNMVDPAIQTGSYSEQGWTQQSPNDWLAGTLVQLDTTTNVPALSLDNLSATIPNYSFETSGFSGWTAQTSWSQSTSDSGDFCTVYPQDGSYFAEDDNSTPFSNPTMIVSLLNANTSALISSTTQNGAGCTWTQISLSVPASAIGTSANLIFTDSQSGKTLTSNSFVLSGTPITWYQNSDAAPNYGESIYIDNVGGNIALSTNYSSGTFVSQIHNIPAINTWGDFAVTDYLSGGSSIAFSICSSSNSNMSAPESCMAISPNAPITISTNSYVQWNATFTITSATQTANLNSATVGWFTGNRAVPMSSTVWDNRYWLSITTNTADTANDSIVVLSNSGVWSPLDIHAGGLAQYKDNLYHSDSQATGNVYLDNQGYSDNGNPINAWVLTKDYPLVNLSQDGAVQAIYPTFSDQANTNVSLSYFVDRNPTAFSLSSVNQTEYLNTTSVKIPVGTTFGSNQVFGETFSFLIQQNDSNPMQFFGLRVLYNEREIQ